MNRRITTLAFLLAAALAACQGASTYAPSAGPMDDSSAAQVSRASFPAPYDAIVSRLPDASALCSAANVKIPGSYISMITTGNVKGSTFTSSGVLNLWFLSKYTKGTKPTPTPSPGTTPTPKASPTPKPVDVYYYTGTYKTRKSKETGCAILIVTVSGKPLSKGEGGGLGVNSVQYSDPYVNEVPELNGPMTENVSGLSASGGHGSATLKTEKGKLYDTATITLTKRGEIKYP